MACGIYLRGIGWVIPHNLRIPLVKVPLLVDLYGYAFGTHDFTILMRPEGLAVMWM